MGVWCKGVYEYVWVYVPNQMASKGFHLVFVYPSVCVYPYVYLGCMGVCPCPMVSNGFNFVSVYPDVCVYPHLSVYSYV